MPYKIALINPRVAFNIRTNIMKEFSKELGLLTLNKLMKQY